MESSEYGPRLFKYYAWTAFMNAIIAIIITLPVFVEGWNMSRVIAGGSAGSWLTVGYLLFFIVGVAMILLCGIIYYVISSVSKRGIFSFRLGLAELVLLEISVLGTCLGLYYFGFVGGQMLIAKQPTPELHEFLVQFVQPAAVFISIGLIGAVLGLINYAVSMTKTK